MAVAAEQHLKIAADQLAAIHPGDLQQLELIDGEVFVNPAPKTSHNEVVNELMHLLGGWIRRHRLGRYFTAPTDVRLSTTDLLQPDFVFVVAERAAIVADDGILGAPDLVVEVLSPSTRDRDRGVKRAVYERSGVREYWLVDPEARQVTLLALEAGRYTEVPLREGRVRSLVLPGLVIDPESLFAGLAAD